MSPPGLYAVWRGTMVALGVAAAFPARAGDVRSHARPFHEYADAVELLLGALTPSELCKLADASIDIAAGLGDSLIVMGLSLGATMAVWTAEHRPEVRRAIVIAPAFAPARVPSLLERP